MKIRTIMPFRPRQPINGLGDAVALVAKPIARVLGLKNCGGCDKRQQKLNEKFPFKQ